MRPPTEKEKIVCPRSGESLVPASVYEVLYKGQGVWRGIVPKHHYGTSKFGANDGELCE